MTPAQVAHITRAKSLWETIKILGLQNEKLALQAIEAALRDAPQAEGWVMVPVEPTPEMLAACEAVDPVMDFPAGTTLTQVHAINNRLFYKALIAARPSAPTAVEPDERAQFEAEFPIPEGMVYWDGEKYGVLPSYENSYRADRYCGQWLAWQARASKGTPL